MPKVSFSAQRTELEDQINSLQSHLSDGNRFPWLFLCTV